MKNGKSTRPGPIRTSLRKAGRKFWDRSKEFIYRLRYKIESLW